MAEAPTVLNLFLNRRPFVGNALPPDYVYKTGNPPRRTAPSNSIPVP